MWKEFDRHTITGIALITLMVGLYTYNASKRAKEYEQQKKNTFKADTTLTTAKLVSDTLKTIPSTPDSTKTTQVAPKQQFVLENELVRVRISNIGGGIEDVTLKSFTTHSEDSVLLLPKGKTALNIKIPTNTGDLQTKNMIFNVLSSSANNIILKSAEGVELRYSLAPKSYNLEQKWLQNGYDNSKTVAVDFQTEMNQLEASLKRERDFSTIKYMPVGDNYTTNLPPNKNTEEKIETPFKYISFTQQFFNATIIPRTPFESGTVSTYYLETDSNYVKKYTASMNIKSMDSIHFNYYIGPTDYKIMKQVGGDLEEVVPLSQDFFLFRWVKIFNKFLIIPIFDFLSKFFNNYGIIILLLTLIVKTALLPLSYKQYKVGVAMKVLRPDIDKLRAKYGDDQQEFTKQQMKLFSEYGVNQFGGCLPLLLQMPILIAMYSFFPSAIELRHEPFLWSNDLSIYDSVLNLPFTIPVYGSHVSLFALLMTITQIATTWYMQRLQPNSPQADQMKMISYIMPIFMLFLFNSFPAALTYYYLLQNIISIAQQFLVTKLFISEEKVRAEIEENKKKPKKLSGFQKKLQEAMEMAEEQKRLQQKNNKK